MLPTKITAALIGIAAVGAAFAMPMAAQADTPAADTEITERARGTVVFRTERYQLSNRAVVSTTPTTIRIVDDSATTQSGTKAGLFIQLGYAHDPRNPTVLRINSGVAVRGYDFATGTYRADQAIQLGEGALSLDSPLWSGATHAWGHLGRRPSAGSTSTCTASTSARRIDRRGPVACGSHALRALPAAVRCAGRPGGRRAPVRRG